MVDIDVVGANGKFCSADVEKERRITGRARLLCTSDAVTGWITSSSVLEGDVAPVDGCEETVESDVLGRTLYAGASLVA